MLIKFKYVRVGQRFEIYGDQFLNYPYPKLCNCIKVTEEKGQEIGGSVFYVNFDDYVRIP